MCSSITSTALCLPTPLPRLLPTASAAERKKAAAAEAAAGSKSEAAREGRLSGKQWFMQQLAAGETRNSSAVLCCTVFDDRVSPVGSVQHVCWQEAAVHVLRCAHTPGLASRTYTLNCTLPPPCPNHLPPPNQPSFSVLTLRNEHAPFLTHSPSHPPNCHPTAGKGESSGSEVGDDEADFDEGLNLGEDEEDEDEDFDFEEGDSDDEDDEEMLEQYLATKAT